MTTSREHYDTLLADLYAWMIGDSNERDRAQFEWIRVVVGAPAAPGSRALDLGAGVGAEAVALARLGYDVVAVDASAKLCREVRRRAGKSGYSVDVVEADIVSFLEREDEPTASVALCVGDTLSHLESRAAVRGMLHAVRARLAPGGRLVVTYRDLSAERRDLDRFFLVRADDSRIFTCFVEYFDDHVIVHDVVHTRSNDGWTMKTSAYPKLRLGSRELHDLLLDAGFVVIEPIPCGPGFTGIVAR